MCNVTEHPAFFRCSHKYIPVKLLRYHSIKLAKKKLVMFLGSQYNASKHSKRSLLTPIYNANVWKYFFFYTADERFYTLCLLSRLLRMMKTALTDGEYVTHVSSRNVGIWLQCDIREHPGLLLAQGEGGRGETGGGGGKERGESGNICAKRQIFRQVRFSYKNCNNSFPTDMKMGKISTHSYAYSTYIMVTNCSRSNAERNCMHHCWVTVKLLGIKVPYTLRWPHIEGTWLYCDYFIWCVSCTVVVLTCSVMCGWVYVRVFWQLYGCFGNRCTCIYCVLYCLYYVFALFRLCTFILFFFVCTSVRITATEWKLNCSK